MSAITPDNKKGNKPMIMTDINETAQAPETWAKIGESVRKVYYVSNLGRAKTYDKLNGDVVIRTSEQLQNKRTGYCQFFRGYIHRYVAEAFIGKAPQGMEVDHISCVKTENQAENLRWVSPEFNRSRNSATIRKRINFKCTQHRGECIRAERMGVIRYFKNGTRCAKALGCSHVLVYNALNGKGSAKRARAWRLSWVPYNGQKLEG